MCLANIKYLVWQPKFCRECGSQDLEIIVNLYYGGGAEFTLCNDCGYEESE
jgi:predicted Zn-ribbon and HTH transcriptional regulator|tara:strand:- start:360 stop:512 length:153 start_codon:yes stop_codon:yes gene_type:complete